MKKVYLSIAASVVLLASCDKVANLAKIDKDVDYTGTVDVNGLPSGDTAIPQVGYIDGQLPKVAIATNSKEFLESNGSSAASDKVESVTLKKFSLSVTLPSNGTFKFMDSVGVYVSADGLSEKLVASKANISNNSKTVDLTCYGENLKEYFLKDSMYVRMGGRFTSVPDSGTRIEFKPTFNVKANLLK